MKLTNKIFTVTLAFIALVIVAGCGIYKFKDISIDPRIKTVKVSFFENRARYVNPQFSPRLKDAIEQKINRQTKLSRTNSDDAHYVVNGYITQYDPSTAGISGQQVATNRLTVSIHITLRKTLDNKTDEFDVTRNFDFPASKSLQQAEGELLEDILRNMSDEIFNQIFSNW